MIEIRPVVTRADLKAFIDLPYQLYRGHPYWVPPLRLTERQRFNRRTNPFFEHADVQFLLAREHGRIRGRLAVADDHRHNETHRDNLATFGFFEADSEAVAAGLLTSAEAWARSRGRARIRGPLNFSLNEMAGLLIEGFNRPPAILMPYNPPEYADYLVASGYLKVKDLFAWSLDLDRPLDPAITALAARVRRRAGVEVRSPSRRTLLREIPAFLDIYAKAWAGNWGFVAPTRAESQRFAEDLKWIADPALVMHASIGNRKVACAVAVPDLNQLLAGTNGRLGPRLLLRLLTSKRRIDRARLLLLGVVPEYRGLGLFPVLLAELAARAPGTRFRRAEFSWVLEDNTEINHAAARVGAERSNTYRLFEKALTA